MFYAMVVTLLAVNSLLYTQMWSHMTYGIILFTAGSCKVTEFLLSKGVPVDIHYGYGTPLHLAATNEQDKIVKILLEHHADVYNPYHFLFSFFVF
jgi:ankyrin repeat protein